MSRSRSRSATSAAVAAAAALALAGCPDGGTCGPGAAAADGLGLAGTGVDVHYQALAASANNDCPEPGAPAGVVSLTIGGTQVGAGFPITLCVPRPDRLDGAAVQLGTDVQVIDLGADAGGGCTLALATTGAPSGTVTAAGVCDDGTSAAGFALTFDGIVPMKRTCGTQVDELDLALTGTVAISGP
jgi:hypothetical protein